MTVCNLSIELGAKIGMVAPDEKTYAYLEGPPPRAARRARGTRRSRTGARCATRATRHSIARRASTQPRIAPQITWGTSPEDVIGVDGVVPDPARETSRIDARRCAALDYMGLQPGEPIAGTKVDWVFIGSCTNCRLPDLRAAAAIAKRSQVAKRVQAWVVPGSLARQAGGRSRGTGRHLPRGGLRMARGRLLDVRGGQRRHGAAGRALRLDHQPQLRRPPGTGRAHASRESRDGRRRGDCGPNHRRAQARRGIGKVKWKSSPA